jgi:hypothetical protein
MSSEPKTRSTRYKPRHLARPGRLAEPSLQQIPRYGIGCVFGASAISRRTMSCATCVTQPPRSIDGGGPISMMRVNQRGAGAASITGTQPGPYPTDPRFAARVHWRRGSRAFRTWVALVGLSERSRDPPPDAAHAPRRRLRAPSRSASHGVPTRRRRFGCPPNAGSSSRVAAPGGQAPTTPCRQAPPRQGVRQRQSVTCRGRSTRRQGQR